MTTPDDRTHDIHDRALWRRSGASDANGSGTSCPSPMSLAAYVDGRTTGPERAAVEAHAAACTACAEAIADVRELLAAQRETPVTAPERVVTRAKVLVGETYAGAPTRLRLAAPSVGAWTALAERLNFRSVGRWGLATAASLGVCVVGYRAGAVSSITTATADMADEAFVAELTFGLELDPADALELLLVGDATPEEPES